MRRYPSSRDEPRRHKGNTAIAAAVAILVILVNLALADSGDNQVLSGKSYTYQVPLPEGGLNYTYLWSASDGYSTSYDQRVFNWTAPEVDAPKDVTIKVKVACLESGCQAANEIKLTVNPRPLGQISLEKLLDGNPDDVKLGATISYTINITNTGQTDIVYLPLVDDYPEEFLRPVSSDISWNDDKGSVLVWNNLLDTPLTPGKSVKVSVSFRVIGVTDQMVVNPVMVDGAKDDTGAEIESQKVENIISGIRYECTSLGPSIACAEDEVLFSALQGMGSYSWEAKDADGKSLGGFNDSTSANVTWTPPGPGIFVISFNNLMCSQHITIKQCKSGIRISKNCDYQAPVHVGDTVTYTYNVTNTGDLSLRDINITDVQNWGPSCQPVYVRGDEGNQMLGPGESWWYECRYVVPDPSDYPKLHIMAYGGSYRTMTIIRKLMDLKARLEIKMDNLKSIRQQFDAKAASLITGYKLVNGVNYTFYNYTNDVTGERLNKVVDQSGSLNETIYEDPITVAVLTTRYGLGGKIIYDELYYPPPATKEYLKIEYDTPSRGYKTFTVTNYESGDTLILVVDEQGKILNKEYRKTPGYRPYEEKFFLKNTATITARTPDGKEVSDSDSFTLEIFRPLPILSVTKKAEPDPVIPGNILNYTIFYENRGGEDAHEAAIKEIYDQNVKFLWADPSPDFGTNNQWKVGDLKKGESGTIWIKVKVNSSAAPGQFIENRVDLTCKENATAQAVINTTVAGSGLNITKTASADIIGAGGNLIYVINYRNEGSEKQTNVAIHDYLDGHVIFENAQPDPTSNIGDHYWWDREDLSPGEGGTIKISVKVKDKNSFSRNATSIFNTYKINSSQTEGRNATLKTLVVHSLWIDKAADKTAYNRDENITYTIRYGNAESNGFTATGISIVDVLPMVDLLMVSPTPSSISDNILRWNIKELKAGENGSIVIVVHMPKKPDMGFKEVSSVKGEGYAYVNKRLSTAEENSALINRANISGYYGAIQSNASSTSTVAIIGAAGTRIRTTEHGSGYYEEDEKSSLKLENRSISLEKSIFAKHRKTTFSLPGGRNIDYESLWSDQTHAENRVLNDVVSEDYLYTDTLSKNSSFQVDMNQTVYNSEAEFKDGMAHISYKKHMQDSPRITKEISEDYHGSFKVLESIDSYGEGVKYEKSSKGKGFISSDKRPARLQRSFEHGSGYYYSEEISQLASIFKDAKMLYAPSNQTAGSMNLSYTSLWKEGMLTKDPSKGLIISEEIRYAPYIKEEAGMEKSSLAFISEFNGTMDIKVADGLSPKRKDHLLDQRFVGNFKINTGISVYTPPKYLYPHVSVSKRAIIIDDNTILFLINVTNDGNKLLSPVNVSDHLPDSLTFINSSIRPKVNRQTNGQFINWTIPTLEISRTLTIKLNTKMKEKIYPYINVVDVEARYMDQILTAHNYTKVDHYGLPCCLGSEGTINLTKVFSVSEVRGYWGGWSPAPCTNLTSEATDCFKDREDYYDTLESCDSVCSCTSTYDVP